MLSPILVSLGSLLPADLEHLPARPDPSREARRLIELAVKRGEIPGAVLWVGRDDEHLIREAVGLRTLEGPHAGEGMTLDTIFDLASLTKVVATATCVMQLVDRGRVQLSAPVARYLPVFSGNGKDSITVEELLLHRGGLIPDNPIGDYEQGPEEAWRRICGLELVAEPGASFMYTDVGYIVLGELVRAVDGRTLDRYAAEEVFEPLGMTDTCFMPPPSDHDRCAPAERRGSGWMRGQVHDPRAYLLGGVAGHAGLFSTARDLSVWCRMILGGGEVDGVRVLSREAVARMTRPDWLSDRTGGRSLGFDVDTPYSSPRGSAFPRGASFGHTGFTGTSLWLDPESQGYWVLLSNRVHPDGAGKVVQLRRQVADRVAPMLRGDLAAPRVLSGVDVLHRQGAGPLKGKRVGLLTHHVGRTIEGIRTIDVLARDPAIQLERIFVPEHGLLAQLEGDVGDGRDRATGVEISSLYGESRRPSPDQLAGLDAVVVDLQDVGVRFYTYSTTLGYLMEACAEAGVRVVVLDRPNPISWMGVRGPAADEDRLAFICYRPIPVTHALTLGELGLLYRDRFDVRCQVEVVPCVGWSRAMRWHSTGLPWLSPSPNLRNPLQAELYPAIGLLEGSNLSVGRGTDEPFERLGAPWLDGVRLAAALEGRGVPGLAFTPIEFTPLESKFAGELCQGVQVQLVDPAAYRPVEAGLTIAWYLNRLHPSEFEVGLVDSRLFSHRTWEALMASSDPGELADTWAADVAEFEGQSLGVRLYR